MVLFTVIILLLATCTNCLDDINRKQSVISKLLEMTLNEIDKIQSKQLSGLVNKCTPSSTNYERFGCCSPSDGAYMKNVMIRDDKFVIFGEIPSGTKIFPVKSLKSQKQHSLDMKFEVGVGSFPPVECTSVFEGSLHVIGKSTVKNVYHAISDNYMPLISQILLDSVVDSDYLYLPRMMLSGFQPLDNSEVPHMRLVDDLFSAGKLPIGSASGKCFRRVVWGHGPHVMYYNTLMYLRRLAANFARLHVAAFYDLKSPPSFEISSLPSQHANNFDHMKIALFSRGSSGKGRSLKGEDKLVSKFSSLGATTLICCDFEKATLQEQLAAAYYADVVIGIHGAGLIHAIFSKQEVIIVELKTLYGFSSSLFALTADARQGVHALIDIKSYFIVGGHNPVDAVLINRVVDAIAAARGRQHNHTISNRIIKLPTKGDMLLGSYPNNSDSFTYHILGPLMTDLSRVCEMSALYTFQAMLGGGVDDHCGVCAPFIS